MTAAFPTHPAPRPAAPPRQQIVPVVEQTQLARDTFRLRIEAPDLARDVVPGQFFMVRAPGVTNPLLARPFALYDTWLDQSGTPAGIDLVYLVVGKMTELMKTWVAGDPVEIWGPLGNGFPIASAQRLLLVAGGIGNTPFPAVAREALGQRAYGRSPPAGSFRPDQITFCYGVRSAEYFAGLDDFAALGIDVLLATDDGSRGHKGFVTELVSQALGQTVASDCRDQPAQAAIFCCGPEPMMHAVAALAAKRQVPCWLSLETPMACGFGACFSCVTKVREEGGAWDYRRVCVEGPIFPASALVL
jgi:dihydroorotate dehydrogenase electron transfer subunit